MRGLEALNLALFVPWSFAAAIAVLPGLGATGSRRLRLVATLSTTVLAAVLLLSLPSATQPSFVLRGPWIAAWGLRFELALDAWRATAFLGLALSASVAAMLDRRSTRAGSAVLCAGFGCAVGSVLAGPPGTALPFLVATLCTPAALALCTRDERRAAPLLRLGLRALLAAGLLTMVGASAAWREAPGPAGWDGLRGAAVLAAVLLAVPLDRRPWWELRDRLGAAPASSLLGLLVIAVPLGTARVALQQLPRTVAGFGTLVAIGLLVVALALGLRSLAHTTLRDRSLDLQRAWIAVSLALLARGPAAAASWALLLLVLVPSAGLLVESLGGAPRRAGAAGLLLISAPPGVGYLLGSSSLADWLPAARLPALLLLAVWLVSAVAVLRPATPASSGLERARLATAMLGLLWALQLGAVLAPGWADDLRGSAARQRELVELSLWRPVEARR